MAGASRASLGIYNVREDVERFLDAMGTVSRQEWAGEYAWREGEWSSPRVATPPKQPA